MPRASSRSTPEPAEGQVPAGDYEPAPDAAGAAFEVEVNKLPESEKSVSPVNEVAKEVIAGRWGRGQRCKDRLQAAGYDVAAVSEEIRNIFNQK